MILKTTSDRRKFKIPMFLQNFLVVKTFFRLYNNRKVNPEVKIMQEKGLGQRTFHYKNTLFTCLLVLIPIIIVSVFNFLILFSYNMKKIQGELRLESERSMEILNNQLNSMANIVSQKRLEKVFSTEAQSKVMTAYYPIIQQLKKDAIWTSFFSDIGYYNVKSNWVYLVNRASQAEEYFGLEEKDNLYYETHNVKIQKEQFLSLKEIGNHTQAIRFCHTDGQNGGVLFAVPLEIRLGEGPLSYMIFVLSDEMLSNLINIREGTICRLDYYGSPIYYANDKMNQKLYLEEEISEEIFSSNIPGYEKYGLQMNWEISRTYQMQSLIPTIMQEAALTFFVLVIGLSSLLYVSRKTYEPIQNLIRKLSPRAEKESFMDEFNYINFVLDDLMDSERFYKESVSDLKKEKYLLAILDNQVEPEQSLYKQCLNAGIRVDRTYFSCILMEDTERNYRLFELLTSERKDQKTDIYSLYIMEKKYLFLLASDLPKAELEKFLSDLVTDQDELVKKGKIVEGVQRVQNTYLSVRRPTKKAELYSTMELQILQGAMETDNVDKMEFVLRMMRGDMNYFGGKEKRILLEKVRTILLEGESGGGISGFWNLFRELAERRSDPHYESADRCNPKNKQQSDSDQTDTAQKSSYDHALY